MSATVVEERPWHKITDQWEMPPITVESLAEIVERHARETPDAPCIEYLGVSLTYGDLDRWANRFANLLIKYGVQRGDVIGIHLPNTPQYIITLVAVSKLACVASGVSPLFTADELAYQANDAGIKFLVTLDQLFNSVVAPNDGKLPTLKAAFVSTPIDFLPVWKKFLAWASRKVPKVDLSRTHQIETIEYWSAINAATDERVLKKTDPDDVVLIQYTGGTTGKPKGAKLTQHNLLCNAAQQETFLPPDGDSETSASVFPYFHLSGVTVCLLGLLRKTRILVIPDPRDLKAFCKAMQKHPPTLFGNVPTLYQMLLDEPEFRKVDFSELKIAISGAGPMPAEAIPKVESIIGEGKFCEAYGLTETSPALTMNPPNRTKPGTVGVPVPGTDIKIVDTETGTREMPFNEPGELIARGPQVFNGYLNLPEETNKALRKFEGDTWFYTGDIARMDEDGYITICDRSKDMLIVGGFKVFSVEVENKLKALDDVELSAVVGTPDEKRPGNDVVNLHVQLSESGKARDPEQVKEKIMSFCREHMAPYKVPKLIHIVDEIPLTAVGKVDKKALRE